MPIGEYWPDMFNNRYCMLCGRTHSVYTPCSVTFTPIPTLGWQCPECGLNHNPETKVCGCNQKTEKAPRFSLYWDTYKSETKQVVDNETNEVYDVNAETIIVLLKQIHGIE